MALGGLIEVLTVPQPKDDGWGLQVDMTHRGYNLDVGVSYGGGNTGSDGQIIAAKVEAYLGKVIGPDFKPHSLINSATFTVDEMKAMGNNLTIATIITQAKLKMGIP